MDLKNQRGIALILVLLLSSAVSVISASLMFLSQTETYATMNYRMMSQARYAGEAAIQRAGHFLMDRTAYALPGPGADPLSNYDRTVSPVTYGGQPVVLSAIDPAIVAPNYPVSAVQSAFYDAARGELAAGNTTLTYGAYATLLSMHAFIAYGGGPGVVQTWQITGIGGIEGPRQATVEVIATVETPKVSANAYAAFATANTCAAMYFHGNVTISSYDSSQGTPATTTQTTGGNVGTNGNMTIQGSVSVQGNLSTPRTGVGSCVDGAITALTEIGSADVTGSLIQLPAAVTYPPPELSVTPPTTNVILDATLLGTPAAACSALGLTYAAPVTSGYSTPWPDTGGNCTVSGGTTLIVRGSGTDVTMPTVSVSSGMTLRFVGSNPPQNVNINALNGAGSIEIEANMSAANSSVTSESVVLKVAGKNADGTEMAIPFDLDAMGWKQNATANAANKYDASALQIVYGGTQAINMDGGNSQSAATIYAPNAAFTLKGTQDLFGSVLAKTVTNAGNAGIHYDRRLSRDFFVAGNPMQSSFSWKRY